MNKDILALTKAIPVNELRAIEQMVKKYNKLASYHDGFVDEFSEPDPEKRRLPPHMDNILHIVINDLKEYEVLFKDLTIFEYLSYFESRANFLHKNGWNLLRNIAGTYQFDNLSAESLGATFEPVPLLNDVGIVMHSHILKSQPRYRYEIKKEYSDVELERHLKEAYKMLSKLADIPAYHIKIQSYVQSLSEQKETGKIHPLEEGLLNAVESNRGDAFITVLIETFKKYTAELDNITPEGSTFSL